MVSGISNVSIPTFAWVLTRVSIRSIDLAAATTATAAAAQAEFPYPNCFTMADDAAAVAAAPDPPSPLSTLIRRQLSRDQRLQVQTLRDHGLTYTAITKELGITLRQVQWACSHQVTPKRHTGQPTVLSQEQTDQLTKLVCSLKEA